MVTPTTRRLISAQHNIEIAVVLRCHSHAVTWRPDEFPRITCQVRRFTHELKQHSSFLSHQAQPLWKTLGRSQFCCLVCWRGFAAWDSHMRSGARRRKHVRLLPDKDACICSSFLYVRLPRYHSEAAILWCGHWNNRLGAIFLVRDNDPLKSQNVTLHTQPYLYVTIHSIGSSNYGTRHQT